MEATEGKRRNKGKRRKQRLSAAVYPTIGPKKKKAELAKPLCECTGDPDRVKIAVQGAERKLVHHAVPLGLGDGSLACPGARAAGFGGSG